MLGCWQERSWQERSDSKQAWGCCLPLRHVYCAASHDINTQPLKGASCIFGAQRVTRGRV